ncbi:hypothetical protein KFV08_07695 [Macrococcoides canis]|uniref:DUF7365 family protein n=1 Tax=Macrococcoides canis TaxID=1855823 RepID=UPI00207D3FDD|nr:hypothetical protein [Macrococcus canis]MCO4095699.1 hypothetical protein [Macrococcus canis]UTH08408.1 hypothetical protein KFV08_07695 [Macrococcus canis]
MQLDQGDLMLWLITVVVPLALTVLGVYQKTSNDKQKHEGRMVLIETAVDTNKNDINDLKTDFKQHQLDVREENRQIRQELKLLHEIKAENTQIFKTLDSIEKKLDKEV